MGHVLSKFKFGEKSREWIQMLFKYAQTCIKTTGCVSKYFNISRSCSQSCPIALIYILHAMTWAIRGDSEIQRIIFRGENGNISRQNSAYLQMTPNYSIGMMNLSTNLMIFYLYMKRRLVQKSIMKRQNIEW